MMSRGVEERGVRLAVVKLDWVHQITPLIRENQCIKRVAAAINTRQIQKKRKQLSQEFLKGFIA